jgi:hypothetical protein
MAGSPTRCVVQVYLYEPDFPGAGKVGSRLFWARGSTVSPWVGVGLGDGLEKIGGEGEGGRVRRDRASLLGDGFISSIALLTQ